MVCRNSGMELGHVDDVVFKVKNSKQGDGHFGLMSKNAVNRAEAYTEGVISALVRFIRPELFYE
ncbi:MAG: putative non-canonical purine NTP phosphatase [Candidatus Curtissbacteria bacterium GW2011_GWA2_41_24]|uniref:inosine/xanthosine triphosphatase n=1 Tax=Candidatus Curtissbacteria bacterium GW2011_GWA2_41_24 TaxID=1618411 RepID=A0A0G0VVA8_9BACT|nr:MAG: putative non-canonical purine NTP phosphatase [Candidatus Curtissbacteria bacterium GW2011_GWA2_41_24]